MPKPLPSAEHLRALFRYDARSGRLYWRKRADAPPGRNGRYAGQVAGTRSGSGVAVYVAGHKLLYAHRIIWKMVHGEDQIEVDHIDCNPFNNRLDNLRAATRADNVRNRRVRRGQSGLRGVSRHQNRWRSLIRFNGRQIHLGVYRTPAAAHAAYRRAARRLFGEFARLD